MTRADFFQSRDRSFGRNPGESFFGSEQTKVQKENNNQHKSQMKNSIFKSEQTEGESVGDLMKKTWNENTWLRLTGYIIVFVIILYFLPTVLDRIAQSIRSGRNVVNALAGG